MLGRIAERTRPLPAESRATLLRPARAPIAPTPAHAARFIKARIAAALRCAGGKRRIDDLVADVPQRLQIPQSQQPHLPKSHGPPGDGPTCDARCRLRTTTLGRRVAASGK